MQIAIYTYPAYISLEVIRISSSTLFNYLTNNRGLEVVVHGWEGELTSLPESGPAIIRASVRMSCSRFDLVNLCTELGYLCIYEQALLLPGQRNLKGDDMLMEVYRFLGKAGLVS